MEISKIPKPYAHWSQLIIFLVFCTAIGVIGHAYYINQRNRIRCDTEESLQAISRLTAKEISYWRNEKIGDAGSIRANTILTQRIIEYLRRSGPVELEEEIHSWMIAFCRNEGYQAAHLYDASPSLKLTTWKPPYPARTFSAEFMRSLKTGEIVISDAVPGLVIAQPHIDLFVPILDRVHDGKPAGVIELCVDVGPNLYDPVLSRPKANLTVESLLIRRDGDSVVFLNDPRGGTKRALIFQIPMSRREHVEVQAVLSHEGIYDGIDDRGVRVLAASCAVPGTGWFLVCKQDLEEIQGPIRRTGWLIFICMSALLLSFGALEAHLMRRDLEFHYALANADLRASEERFRRIVETATEGIWEIDQQCRTTFVNRTMAEMLGYTVAEIMGRPATAFMFEDQQLDFLTRMDPHGKFSSVPYERKLRHKDGSERWLLVSSTQILDSHNEFAGSFAMFTDITRRKRSQEQIANISKLLNDALIAGKVTLWEWDISSGIVEWTDTVDTLLGYNSGEFPRTFDAWEASIHSDDRQKVLHEFSTNIDMGTPYEMAYRIRTKKQDYVWWHDAGRAIRDAQGRVVRMTGACIDITAHALLEEALQESENKYRGLVETINDVIFTIDADGIITYISPAIEKILDISPESLIGKSFITLIHSDDAERISGRFSELKSGVVKESEFRVISKSDEPKWVRTSSEPIIKNGIFIEARGMLSDFTERKRLEYERETATDALQHSEEKYRALSRRLMTVQEEEKRRFARELHDEIGQTLTALQVSIEAGTLSMKGMENPHIERAMALVREMSGAIRDISLNLRPTMLDDLGLLPALLWLIRRCEIHMNLIADFQHDGLNRRFDPDVETAAYRIVQEALTNIVRYAGVDQASVRCSASEQRLLISIEDNGAGFDASDSRMHGSGLSGMEDRVSLLNGRMTIKSAPGCGTNIVIHLPLTSRESAAHGGDDLMVK